MPNIKSIITTHNKKILHQTEESENKSTCNCIKKELCPIDQKCLESNIVYEATISSNLGNCKKTYIGACETTFKLRYANHKKSFCNERYKNDTTLSKEFWRIKKENGTPIISWKIRKRCQPPNRRSKKCCLCINEKFEILRFEGQHILNKRSDLVTKCRHSNKYNLSAYK